MKPTKKLLYFFTFILTSNFINTSILIPILTPLFLKTEYNFFSHEITFQTRAFLLGLALSVYPIAIYIGSPIFGKICDSIGRKKVLMFATFIVALGNIITATGIEFKNIYLILLGRFIAGITGGTSTPIKAIISDISDATNRSKNFSCVSLAICFSLILGPLLGAELSNKDIVSWFHFSTPLYFLFSLSMLNLFLIFRYIKETLNETIPFKIDLKAPFTQIKDIASIKELRLIMMVLLFYVLGYNIFSNTFQTYLVKEFNINSRQIGMIYTYMGCISLIIQLFVYNPLAKYLKPEKVISYALIVYAFSMFLIVSINNFNYIYLALIITLLARSFIQTLLVSCVAAKGSSNKQGKYHGYHSSVQAVGELLGPLFGGILAGKFISLPLVFSALSMIIAWFVIEKIKKHELNA